MDGSMVSPSHQVKRHKLEHKHMKKHKHKEHKETGMGTRGGRNQSDSKVHKEEWQREEQRHKHKKKYDGSNTSWRGVTI